MPDDSDIIGGGPPTTDIGLVPGEQEAGTGDGGIPGYDPAREDAEVSGGGGTAERDTETDRASDPSAGSGDDFQEGDIPGYDPNRLNRDADISDSTRQQLKQQFAEGSPFAPSDVVVGELQGETTARIADQALRREAAEQSQFAASALRVTRQDGQVQVRPTEDAVSRQTERQLATASGREKAAIVASANRFAVGMDRIPRQGMGFGPLTKVPGTTREEERQLLQLGRIGLAADTGDIDVSGGDVFSSDLQQRLEERAIQRSKVEAASKTELTPSDYTVGRFGGKTRVVPKRSATRRQIEQQTGLEAGEDFQLTRTAMGGFGIQQVDEQPTEQDPVQQYRPFEQPDRQPSARLQAIASQAITGDVTQGQPASTPRQATQAPGLLRPDVSADESILTSLTTGGLLVETGPGSEEQLTALSQRYGAANRFVAGNVGGFVDTLVRPITSETGGTILGNYAQGITSAIGGAGNIFAATQVTETGVEAGQGIIEESVDVNLGGDGPVVGLDQPLETAETTAVVGGQIGMQAGRASVESLEERPAQTLGAITGGALTSLAVGAGGKRLFTAARGRIATGDLDFQGSVAYNPLERRDISSGLSRLTRFSEEAVPGGRRSMPAEDFPVETAPLDPNQELKNLAAEYSNPQLDEALGLADDEYSLFSARSGLKGETFEPRSGRPYDPDAAFLAGSVSRNFLDVEPSDSGFLSGGIRRPKPVAAVRSLIDAYRGEGIPNIVVTGGRIEAMPEGVESRGEITDFLEEQANNNVFYTRRPDIQSGEAEALVSAEGAVSKTDPDPGAGRVEPGEATTFVEVARPFKTTVRGETVPIQLFRQDTGDVTPISQQGSLLGLDEFVADTRGALLRGRSGDIDTGTARRGALSDLTERSYTPGGEPGTPFSPTLAGFAASRGISPGEADSQPAVSPGVERPSPTEPSEPGVSEASLPGIGESFTPPGSDPGPTGGPSSTPSPDPEYPTYPVGDPTYPSGYPTEPIDYPTDTPYTPFTPPGEPTNRRRDLGLPDLEADEKEEDSSLLGAVNPRVYDFRNPLTGDVIATEQPGETPTGFFKI